MKMEKLAIENNNKMYKYCKAGKKEFPFKREMADKTCSP